MSIQKILFVAFLFFFSGFVTPSEAAIATPNRVKDANSSVDFQKGKRLSLKEKIKLIRQVRTKIKAAKKAKKAAKVSPEGTTSIMQNRLFVLGLILFLVGLVVGVLRIPIVSWLAGAVALAGFILMIVALVQEFT